MLPDCEAWAILETTPAMVWLGDVQGNCVFLNRALREFWGVADLEGFSWADTLHPDDATLLGLPYAKAMAGQTALSVEARYRRADGMWRWLRTEANPRFDAAGQFTGMVGVNVDVTDQRTAEADLRRSRDQLEFAIEAAGEVGTWLWDVQRNEIRADRMTCCGLQTGAENGATGDLQQFLSVIHPDDRERVVEEITVAVQTGEAYRTEFRISGAGGERWVSASGRCERDAQGKPLVFAGLTVDVTERRRREEETLIVSRELSHRLKNAWKRCRDVSVRWARRICSRCRTGPNRSARRVCGSSRRRYSNPIAKAAMRRAGAALIWRYCPRTRQPLP